MGAVLSEQYFKDNTLTMYGSYETWTDIIFKRLELCAKSPCQFNPIQMYFRKITELGGECNDYCPSKVGMGGKYPSTDCRGASRTIFCKALADSWEWFATDINPDDLVDQDLCIESACSENAELTCAAQGRAGDIGCETQKAAYCQQHKTTELLAQGYLATCPETISDAEADTIFAAAATCDSNAASQCAADHPDVVVDNAVIWACRAYKKYRCMAERSSLL